MGRVSVSGQSHIFSTAQLCGDVILEGKTRIGDQARGQATPITSAFGLLASVSMQSLLLNDKMAPLGYIWRWF